MRIDRLRQNRAVPVRQGGWQNGQAVIEGLVVAGVLGSLVAGGIWLGGLQDVGLQLQHASRRVAFGHAHQGLQPDDLWTGVDGYLASPGHEWRTRRGDSLVHQGDRGPATGYDKLSVHAALESLMLQPSRQPGDDVAAAAQWRTELRLGNARVWRAGVSVSTGSGRHAGGALHDFDRAGLDLHRATAILAGSGAARDDATVQQTLANSTQAWGRLTDVSRHEGQALQRRLQRLDGAWGRAHPGWDWLSAWAGEVPAGRLRPWSRP
ncbi:hypothetical protein [Castellaniella sp. UC4442_H9]